ncbi:MAG: hypothetical protein N3E40_04870, partial [Dehalococcoidia bacterium]|nr:hypothetical protein [Dehalococcoidia bacterium]
LEGYTARASISRDDLIKGIDGTMDFAGMFIKDFKAILSPSKGQIYDYGGDFMLLGPAVDAFARYYQTNQSFRKEVDSCR